MHSEQLTYVCDAGDGFQKAKSDGGVVLLLYNLAVHRTSMHAAHCGVSSAEPWLEQVSPRWQEGVLPCKSACQVVLTLQCLHPNKIESTEGQNKFTFYNNVSISKPSVDSLVIPRRTALRKAIQWQNLLPYM